MRANIAVLQLLFCAVHSWELPSFAQSVIDIIYPPLSSPIPQFILDLHHPWIRENERWLRRQKNAAQLLCSLDSTLRPNQTISTHSTPSYPMDLFSRLEISNKYYNRPGWDNAVARLHEMLDCPAALLDATELHIHIKLDRGYYSDPKERPHNLPATLPDLFANALLAMQNLRSLHWGVPAPQTRKFDPVFAARNLNLPSVIDLHASAYSEYMLRICPGILGLQEFDIDYGFLNPDARLLLIRATASATNITRFGLKYWTEGWNATLIEEIPSAMPNITRIDVLEGGSVGSYDETEEQLTNFVGILAKFPKLVDLSLPYSGSLGVGFDGGPGCGNAYLGPDGRDLERRVTKDSAVATDMASKIVVEGLPNLLTLSIGGRAENIATSPEGRTVPWPWTGRMDEWVCEMVPDGDYQEYEQW